MTIWFTPIDPGSTEQDTYARSDPLFFWDRLPFTWKWKLSGAVGPFPKARLLASGNPCSDWVTSSNGTYPFTITTLAVLQYVSGVEFDPPRPDVYVMAKGFEYNDTGAALPAQAPWTAINRFDVTYGNAKPASLQVPYPHPLPPPKLVPFKPRQVIPYNTVLPKDKLWVRAIFDNWEIKNVRRLRVSPTGSRCVSAEQRYPYSQATTIAGAKLGPEPPHFFVADGVRGVGSFGYVAKVTVRRGGKMFYFTETCGRVGIANLETLNVPGEIPALPKQQSEIKTVAGWRLIPGETMVHPDVWSSNYMYGPNGIKKPNGQPDNRPEHRALYDSKFEHLGVWDQVSGPHVFWEPWGHCVARLLPNGTVDVRDGLEMWLADTRHHRVLFCNLWTAHPPAYRAPDFPPASYSPPTGPTGQVELSDFVGPPDGQPVGRSFADCWGVAFNPFNRRVYWSNFSGDSIYSSNTEGTDIRPVIECSIHPTGAQLGIAKRLGQGKSAQYCRDNFWIDGPVGTATCVRPQDIGFTSTGELVWVERYTYLTRVLNEQTGMVRTLKAIPAGEIPRTTESSSANDIGITIDTEGTCGPVDDVLSQGWNQMDYRQSIDGTRCTRLWWTSGATCNNGPLNRCITPGYSFAIGCGDGRIIGPGNAGGSPFIEVTQRLPTDTWDAQVWTAGADAYKDRSQMVLACGPFSGNTLGYQTWESLKAQGVQAIQAYGVKWGVVDIASFTAYVLMQAQDNENPVVQPPRLDDIKMLFSALPVNVTAITLDGQPVTLPCEIPTTPGAGHKIKATGPGGSVEYDVMAGVNKV